MRKHVLMVPMSDEDLAAVDVVLEAAQSVHYFFASMGSPHEPLDAALRIVNRFGSSRFGGLGRPGTETWIEVPDPAPVKSDEATDGTKEPVAS